MTRRTFKKLLKKVKVASGLDMARNVARNAAISALGFHAGRSGTRAILRRRKVPIAGPALAGLGLGAGLGSVVLGKKKESSYSAAEWNALQRGIDLMSGAAAIGRGAQESIVADNVRRFGRRAGAFGLGLGAGGTAVAAHKLKSKFKQEG